MDNSKTHMMIHCSAGLPRDHPESYHFYMFNNFFKHIDIEPSNVHILDGNATDLAAECASFEAKITEAGGVHLFIGGKLTTSKYIYKLKTYSLNLHELLL